MLKFDLPKNESNIIKVLGVGGGGSNAVNHMFQQGIKGVDFIICNTDSQAIDISPVPNKIQLGIGLTEGRGAGSVPDVGKRAALESLEQLKEHLSRNTKMLFITAGMGGGTGTGAAPVIAEIASELEILTVGIVTLPFAFEGRKRKQQAEQGIMELRQHVDSLIIIQNDKLRDYGNLPLSQAFQKADNVLTNAAKGIAEIITGTGYINVDFADVKTVMKNSGVAIMGSGMAEGENRAIKAVEAALSSPLLNDNEIQGASNILLNITSGIEEISMDEVTEITDYIQEEAGQTAEIIWGNAKDENLGKQIHVTIVATGFDANMDLGYDIFAPKIEKKYFKLNSETSAKKEDEPNEDFKLIVKKSKSDELEVNYTDNNAPIQTTSLIEEFEEDKILEVSDNFVLTRKTKKKLESKQMDLEEAIETNEEVDESKTKIQLKERERIDRLKEMSLKLKTSIGISELENEPAYKRRNIKLNNVTPSNHSIISRYTLSEDEDKNVEIKSNNSFLHDNVD